MVGLGLKEFATNEVYNIVDEILEKLVTMEMYNLVDENQLKASEKIVNLENSIKEMHKIINIMEKAKNKILKA